MLVSNESIESTRGGDNDVGVRLLVLQQLGVLLDRGSTIEDSGLNIWHVLAEACVLVLDLVGKLTSMAHNQYRGLSCNGIDLLEGGQDEDSGLTKTRFGLAENIRTKNGLRNAYLLDCRYTEPKLDKSLPEFDVQGFATSVHLNNRIRQAKTAPRNHRSIAQPLPQKAQL